MNKNETDDASLAMLTIVGVAFCALVAGAVLGSVFTHTLNGDFNQHDKQLMNQYGALDLEQARTSGGLVFGQ